MSFTAGRAVVAGMLALVFLLLTINTAIVQAEPTFPAIHIVRKVENIALRKTIQELYAFCVQLKGGKGVAAAPDWAKMGFGEHEEYFYKQNYALYERWTNYEVDIAGNCAIKKSKMHKAEIDNGRYKYELDLVERSGIKLPSQVKIQQMLHRQFKQVNEQMPGIDQALLHGLKETGLVREKRPGEELEAIKRATIAGQPCEYIPMLDGKAGEYCVWSKMPEYPAEVEREIVLKSDFGADGDWMQREKATKFEVRDKFDDLKMFEPPAGIKLEDRSQLPY